MRLLRSIALGVLSVSAAAGPAARADHDRTGYRVRFNRADLSKPGEAEALHRRIRAAAFRTCLTGPGFEATLERHYLCIRPAVENAVKQIGDPQLTAVHLQWTHGRSTDVSNNASIRELP